MTLNNSDVTLIMEFLASRICHDLVSPVGAINNGLEFMEDMADDPQGMKTATDLIAHSAGAASARLMAFRLAYGAGGREGNIKPEDIQKAFGALIRSDGKIRQSWDPFGPLGISPATRGFLKTLIGTLILGTECLPKGGTIYVDPGQGEQTLVRAEGTGATIRENVENALAGTIALGDMDPRLAHPYVVGIAARTYNFDVQLKDKDETHVTWAITHTPTA